MGIEYRVIPFIGKINNKQSAVDVSDQLEKVINEGAKEGWIFDQLNSVNIEVQPGCLAGFLGKKAEYTHFDMVVFKKET